MRAWPAVGEPSRGGAAEGQAGAAPTQPGWRRPRRHGGGPFRRHGQAEGGEEAGRQWRVWGREVGRSELRLRRRLSAGTRRPLSVHTVLLFGKLCFLAFVRDFKQWWEESCHQPACPCGSWFRILLWVSAVRGGRGWCALAALGWEASPLGI